VLTDAAGELKVADATVLSASSMLEPGVGEGLR